MAIQVSGGGPSNIQSAPSTLGSKQRTTNPVAAEKVASPQQDTVKLSPAAQAHALKIQGQSVNQIAANLGVSVATIDGYLFIPAPKAPAASADISAGKPAPTGK